MIAMPACYPRIGSIHGTGDSAVPDRGTRGRAGRSAAAAAPDALARAGDRGRLVAGGAAGLPAGPVRVLGGRLRLAAGRGAAERAAAVPDGDRRGVYRVRPRPFAAAGRAPADPDPRLARFRGRVLEGHRATVG